jgi:hypothetical protein
MDGLLTDRERHELVAVLRQLDPQAPAEQRRTPRRKALVSLWIRRIGKGQSKAPAKQVLVNVSEQGVGMLGKAAFANGDKFVMPLRFDEGGGWLVLCEVRNSKALPNGHYKVGCKFIDRIEDPQGDAKIPGDWLAYGR